MEVILLEKIAGLGEIGAVVAVKNGFARNYLVPRRKCLRATAENRRVVEQKRAILEQQDAEKRKQAEAGSILLAGAMVSVVRQAAEDGRLYGSVTAKDIAVALSTALNVAVLDDMVALSSRIRATGIHSVKVVLHPDVHVSVVVNVARSDQEAAAAADAHKKSLEPDEAAKSSTE